MADQSADLDAPKLVAQWVLKASPDVLAQVLRGCIDAEIEGLGPVLACVLGQLLTQEAALLMMRNPAAAFPDGVPPGPIDWRATAAGLLRSVNTISAAVRDHWAGGGPNAAARVDRPTTKSRRREERIAAALTPALREVFDVLRERGPMTRDELAAALPRVGWTALGARIEHLCRAGKVRGTHIAGQSLRKVYQITPESLEDHHG